MRGVAGTSLQTIEDFPKGEAFEKLCLWAIERGKLSSSGDGTRCERPPEERTPEWDSLVSLNVAVITARDCLSQMPSATTPLTHMLTPLIGKVGEDKRSPYEVLLTKASEIDLLFTNDCPHPEFGQRSVALCRHAKMLQSCLDDISLEELNKEFVEQVRLYWPPISAVYERLANDLDLKEDSDGEQSVVPPVVRDNLSLIRASKAIFEEISKANFSVDAQVLETVIDDSIILSGRTPSDRRYAPLILSHLRALQKLDEYSDGDQFFGEDADGLFDFVHLAADYCSVHLAEKRKRELVDS